jgi:phosphate transport system protein
MMKHFRQEMEELAGELLRLTDAVEQAIEKAIRSLLQRRADLAEEVIRGDDAIDREEIRLEEECIRILVLHQPVATDLRSVVAALKINSDLERMADLAAEIGEHALALARTPDHRPFPDGLQAMTDRVVQMERDSINAFVRSDSDGARAVCVLDQEIDRDHREIIDALKATIRSDPDQLDAGFHLFSIARYLERIADHAANIAEDVVYMKEGKIIRHQPEHLAAAM